MEQRQLYTEQDWRLFRSKVAQWQESHMDKLIQEYIALLSADGNPSEKFWQLEKRIRKDKQQTGVQVDMRRSMLAHNLIELLQEGVITLDDLDGFSESLQGALRFMLER